MTWPRAAIIAAIMALAAAVLVPNCNRSSPSRSPEPDLTYAWTGSRLIFYKTRYVSGDVILEQLRDHYRGYGLRAAPRLVKINPEGSRDILLITFGHPSIARVLEAIVTRIDVPGTGSVSPLPDVESPFASMSNKLAQFDPEVALDRPGVTNAAATSLSDLHNHQGAKLYLGLDERTGWGGGGEVDAFYFPDWPPAVSLNIHRREPELQYWIWLLPTGREVPFREEFSDFVVYPKCLGRTATYTLYALIDAPTVEEKERYYRRLQTWFLEDAATATKIINNAGMPSENATTNLITDTSVGGAYLGQFIQELVRRYQHQWLVSIGGQNKGNGSVPAFRMYPDSTSGPYPQREIMRGEYDDATKRIYYLSVSDEKFALVNGVRPGMNGRQFIAAAPGYKIIKQTQRTPTSNIYYAVTMPGYDNVRLGFEGRENTAFEDARLNCIEVGEEREGRPLSFDQNAVCVYDDERYRELERSAGETGRLDMNKASVAELVTFDEIPTNIAYAIVDYRRTHNGFKSYGEISRVRYIGTSTVDAIRAKITIGPYNPAVDSQPIPAAVAPSGIGYKINLNTASAEELSLIPEIGSSMANAIIARRMRRGNFTSIEELLEFPDIGEATFDRIKTFITVAPTQASRPSSPADPTSARTRGRGR